jgi:ribosomal protein L29
MTDAKTEDIKKASDAELKKLLTEALKQKAVIGLKLRANQSHDQKTYQSNKKMVAQIKTELRSRELTAQSN